MLKLMNSIFCQVQLTMVFIILKFFYCNTCVESAYRVVNWFCFCKA